MNKILIVMTFLSTLFGVKAQESEAVQILNATEFKEATSNGNVQLVDVRSPREMQQGAIEGAINIDYFQQDTFKTECAKLDTSRPVYLYCRSGNRSQKASVILQDMGFTQIFDLKGGFMMWPYKE